MKDATEHIAELQAECRRLATVAEAFQKENFELHLKVDRQADRIEAMAAQFAALAAVAQRALALAEAR